ncbi:hypothetical protein RIF29_14620 [Crotalaria pallida]|uniref:Uncharacterized protein n=1 Tax=Crotalaria pallida TaxID=3830 RepID=A0AAN9ICW8_CROPI
MAIDDGTIPEENGERALASVKEVLQSTANVTEAIAGTASSGKGNQIESASVSSAKGYAHGIGKDAASVEIQDKDGWTPVRTRSKNQIRLEQQKDIIQKEADLRDRLNFVQELLVQHPADISIQSEEKKMHSQYVENEVSAMFVDFYKKLFARKHHYNWNESIFSIGPVLSTDQ